MISVLNIPIYKQSVNARRMTGIHRAPPGEYDGTVYCFDRPI